MSRVKLSNVYVPSYCCFIMQPRGPHWAQMWRRKLAVDIVQWTCNGQSGIIAHTCVAEEASPSCSGGGHCSVDTASRGKPLLDNQVSDEIPSVLATVPPTQLLHHHSHHCPFCKSKNCFKFNVRIQPGDCHWLLSHLCCQVLVEASWKFFVVVIFKCFCHCFFVIVITVVI